MKTLNVVLATLLLSLSAQASGITLTRFNMDAGHISKPGKPAAGSIVIDSAANEVTLSVSFSYFCPPGLNCILSMPSPLLVTLPIVSVTTDACGTVTTIAEEDKRPVDGMYQQVIVEDNSNRFCYDLRFAQVAATYSSSFYDRFESKEVSAHSKFAGRISAE